MYPLGYEELICFSSLAYSLFRWLPRFLYRLVIGCRWLVH